MSVIFWVLIVLLHVFLIAWIVFALDGISGSIEKSVKLNENKMLDAEKVAKRFLEIESGAKASHSNINQINNYLDALREELEKTRIELSNLKLDYYGPKIKKAKPK